MKCGFPSEKLSDLLHKREQCLLAWQYPPQWVRNRKRLLSGFKSYTSTKHLNFLLFFIEFLILQPYVSGSRGLICFKLVSLVGRECIRGMLVFLKLQSLCWGSYTFPHFSELSSIHCSFAVWAFFFYTSFLEV